jgi:two-component system, NarL family, sensor kinase
MEISKEVDIFFFLFAGTLGMITLAGGVIAFFMVYQRRLMRKQGELHEMEMKHKEELLYGNIEMLENERKRIAKDLHDDIGHVFSTLSWRLRQLDATAGKEEITAILKDAQDLINTGVHSVRTITHDMVPYGFEIFGLITAIQNLCDRAMASGVLDINFEYNENMSSLSDDACLNIYRIIQELISNTIKYAGASRIDIQLAAGPTVLVLNYNDNGKGFIIGEGNKKRKGYGLSNIESRIHMLGARHTYATEPGKGVQVEITIPIKDEHGANNHTGSSGR